jgi:RimJ/RimL family protein N-acetyltransferase
VAQPGLVRQFGPDRHRLAEDLIQADPPVVGAGPAVRHYFWNGEIISRRETERAIRASLSAFSEFGVGQWVIQLREGEQFVGSAGLLTADDPFFDRELLPADQDLVELIFALLPAYRRRGYATEAVQAVLDFAFNTAVLSRVVAIADTPNIGSIRVLEKVSMPRTAIQIFGRVYPGTVSKPGIGKVADGTVLASFSSLLPGTLSG